MHFMNKNVPAKRDETFTWEKNVPPKRDLGFIKVGSPLGGRIYFHINTLKGCLYGEETSRQSEGLG